MKNNYSEQYVSSAPEEASAVGTLISPKAFWEAMAHDYGAHNARRQKKGTYELSGFNDLEYVDDDLRALSLVEKLKAPEVGPARSVNGLPPQMRLEGRLRRIMPVFMARFLSGVRPAEQFQAVYDVARSHGYLDENYVVTPKINVWVDPTPESLAKVVEFLADLQARFRSDEFHERMATRVEMATKELNAQESLLEAVTSRYGQFHVAVYDIGVHESPVVFSSFSSSTRYEASSLLRSGRQLIADMQSSATLGSQCLGAFVHLEFHKDRGFYLRSFFLVSPGDLGFRQQFEVRFVRAWQAISGRRGWVEDRRGHANKLIGSIGMVSVNDGGSISRVRKAISYGVHKDLAMRVDTVDHSTFIVADLQPFALHGDSAFLPAR